LKRGDFTTATRIVDAINDHFHQFLASTSDPSTVILEVPRTYRSEIVDFLSEVEQIVVEVDGASKVVINERTGTVVMGADITIEPIAISHGSLSVEVGETSGKAENMVSVKGSTVGELVSVLNALGAQPKDLVSILQAIHAAGAIHAELTFL